MSGGFCSNCHEEVFIVEQYSELGEDVPTSIQNKANEHINSEDRIKLVKKQRAAESKKVREEHFATYGEYPQS